MININLNFSYLLEIQAQEDKRIAGTMISKVANYVMLYSYYTLINKEKNHFPTDFSHLKNNYFQKLKAGQ